MNLAQFHKLTYKTRNVKLISKLLYVIQYLIYNSSLPATVKIGKGTRFAYLGIGVVIHARAIIGNNCTIGQGITIGGRSKKYNVPKIGDNCYLGAGCRVLGDIVIGDNVIIAPNSVVLIDVPSNCIVAGIPGKIIKEKIDPNDYI